MSPAGFVVDASVAAKWVLHEKGRPAALSFLKGYEEGRYRLFAPRLIIAEVGNVLWKKCRRRELTRAQAAQAFSFFLARAPSLLDTRAVSESALGLAAAHDRSYYDALYSALALAIGCELVTADENFYRAVETAFPMARLLDNAEGL